MCDELYPELNDNNSCFDKNASLVIKQEAIVNNVRYIKESTGAKVIAVVKENGYGIGIANLYNIIKDEDIFLYAVTSPCNRQDRRIPHDDRCYGESRCRRRYSKDPG